LATIAAGAALLLGTLLVAMRMVGLLPPRR
jgi:hypothetical protein